MPFLIIFCHSFEFHFNYFDEVITLSLFSLNLETVDFRFAHLISDLNVVNDLRYFCRKEEPVIFVKIVLG